MCMDITELIGRGSAPLQAPGQDGREGGGGDGAIGGGEGEELARRVAASHQKRTHH